MKGTVISVFKVKGAAADHFTNIFTMQDALANYIGHKRFPKPLDVT